MKTVMILGADGFIGGHLAKRLHSEGHQVIGIGQHEPKYGPIPGEYRINDLRIPAEAEAAFNFAERIAAKGSLDKKGQIDEVYHLAADMGGIGYISSNFATICRNNTRITLNVLDQAVEQNVGKLFYSSSACAYPLNRQHESEVTSLKESDAFPADAEKGYGWEKLYGELLCQYYAEEFGLNVRVARFHNVMGPSGAWIGGREKAPAAACRKVAEAHDGDVIEIWGDGQATRSFLYIDDCLDAVALLMASNHTQAINIGSEELVTVDQLYKYTTQISGKSLRFRHLLDKPQGVRGRNSDNTLVRQVLGWEPKWSLRQGLEPTYAWINEQVKADAARTSMSH